MSASFRHHDSSGPYRDVLKASSVRGMLQRKARLADVARPMSGREPEAIRPPPDAPTALRDLECDGAARTIAERSMVPLRLARLGRLGGLPAVKDRSEDDPFPS